MSLIEEVHDSGFTEEDVELFLYGTFLHLV